MVITKLNVNLVNNNNNSNNNNSNYNNNSVNGNSDGNIGVISRITTNGSDTRNNLLNNNKNDNLSYKDKTESAPICDDTRNRIEYHQASFI